MKKLGLILAPKPLLIGLLCCSLMACSVPHLRLDHSKLQSNDLSVQFDEHLQYFYGVLNYAKQRRKDVNLRSKIMSFVAGAFAAMASLNEAVVDGRSQQSKTNDTAKLTFVAGVATLWTPIFNEDPTGPSEDIGRFEALLTFGVRRKNDLDLDFSLCEARGKGPEVALSCARQRDDRIHVLILEFKEQCGALFGDIPQIECFPEKFQRLTVPPAEEQPAAKS